MSGANMKVSKIIFYALIAVFAVLLLPILIYNLPFIIGGNGAFIVMSGSMEPAVHIGSVVITESINAGELKEGDIITFKRENNFITHRIVEITESGIKTRGDASEDADSSLTKAENIRGKLLFSIPSMGYYVFYAGRYILFSAALVILIYFIYDFVKGTRGKKKK